MATTDAKPGFRLPWSSDRTETANPPDAAPDSASGEPSNPPQEIETPEMIDAAPAAPDHKAAVEMPAVAEPTPASTSAPAPNPAPMSSPARKPNKFMADLTKAMQAAAETAREDTLTRYNAEAKTYVEGIHAASATEATDLRKQADDDVAAIREWSKAEIARIREETDERISHRKGGLEAEIEEHAAAIEARIERVQSRVNAFETEMAAFFERLIAEDDPTRFAAMAESMPEPPPFDGPAMERASVWTPAPEPEPETHAAVESFAETAPESVVEPVTEVIAEAPVADPAWGAAPDAAPADPTWGDAPLPTPSADDAGDLFSMDVETSPDPRLSMLGLTPDLAAAEAEAASFTPAEDGSDEEVPEIGDDAISARLAGLVPDGEPAGEAVATRVIVTGLISVASIAGFKRHLSRAAGVQSVGVSSGPDGEFVFTVSHGSDIVLRDVIPALPGFGARITAETDGELTVAARDPESES